MATKLSCIVVDHSLIDSMKNVSADKKVNTLRIPKNLIKALIFN